MHGPPFPLDPKGTTGEAELQKKYGARIIGERDLHPGPDPDTYVFTRYSVMTNIYRVILPQ